VHCNEKKTIKNNLESKFEEISKEDLSLQLMKPYKKNIKTNESVDTKDLLKQSVKRKTQEILQKINTENSNNALSDYLIDGEFETWNIRKSPKKFEQK